MEHRIHYPFFNPVLLCWLPIQIRAEQLAKEGWEYSPVFTMKFHAKERKMDLVRRRRWHRKMVQDDPSAPAVFHIDVGGSDDVRISSGHYIHEKKTVFKNCKAMGYMLLCNLIEPNFNERKEYVQVPLKVLLQYVLKAKVVLSCFS